MTDHLRDAAQPPRLELTTRLRFDAPGGMRGAADRCMNIGLCRKASTGVMCPSYMATREEEHSTRGRANALLPDHPRAQAVAAATRLPEELLVEAIAAGRLVLPRDNRGRRILFHGHCHQKALAGTAATVALLRSIPGADVTEVDAGCCGMAGSFGFEAEHYELSMSIGELRLFPAVRAQAPETVIAATGVSCRQQIAHGTGRPARHPLEIVREALAPWSSG